MKCEPARPLELPITFSEESQWECCSHRWQALFFHGSLHPQPKVKSCSDRDNNVRGRQARSIISTFHSSPELFGCCFVFLPLMASSKENNQQDAQECPVCYDSLSASERTLSCGHVFCHDCLVKTLVSINADGNIRDTIACPVCRHLTFIKKQKDAPPSSSAATDPRAVQTLEVPIPLPVDQPQGARRTSTDREVKWIARCFGGISERLRRQRLICPGQNASQIFIISTEGRPMSENDALSVALAVVQPQRRRRRRICTTARCLMALLCAFTLLALVAATLPWILLA